MAVNSSEICETFGVVVRPAACHAYGEACDMNPCLKQTVAFCAAAHVLHITCKL